MYRVIPRGIPLTREFRVFLEENGKLVSFWKDVPLNIPGSDPSDAAVHMITEIPAHSRGKFEISLEESHNPIAQDVNSQGGLRFLVPKVPFHYGALPQTLGVGDGDPLDVVDLTPMAVNSQGVEGVGKIRKVRVLGGFCLLDQGEEDWKIFAVDEDAALSWQSVEDVPTTIVDNVVHWFKTYKTFEGKQMNDVRGGLLNKKEILEIVESANKEFWRFNK
jgi:inorganic pyrophosphatase